MNTVQFICITQAKYHSTFTKIHYPDRVCVCMCCMHYSYRLSSIGVERENKIALPLALISFSSVCFTNTYRERETYSPSTKIRRSLNTSRCGHPRFMDSFKSLSFFKVQFYGQFYCPKRETYSPSTKIRRSFSSVCFTNTYRERETYSPSTKIRRSLNTSPIFLSNPRFMAISCVDITSDFLSLLLSISFCNSCL